jgi:hypothetical protein
LRRSNFTQCGLAVIVGAWLVAKLIVPVLTRRYLAVGRLETLAKRSPSL